MREDRRATESAEPLDLGPDDAAEPAALRTSGAVEEPPPGFKGAYARAARDPAEPQVLSDLLSLVGYEASARAIASWPMERRIEAEVHAVNVHLRASDNVLRKHPRPAWMPEPWEGVPEGESSVSPPGGTPLDAAFAKGDELS